MYQTFLTFIEKKKLLSEGDQVLVGVSGGVDSVVLLHLLNRVGFKVAVAHVNYNLRGENSLKDALLVEQLCAELKIPFHIKDVAKEAYEVSESIQMVARNIRYDFFNELCSGYGYQKIATAHNANDNIETVLFNFTKGTGISGLAGIAVKKEKVIRPLLFAQKEAIYSFAETEHLKWREDKSNQKSDYHRNLIRNEVIPILRKINPSLESTFEDTSERISGVSEIIRGIVQSHLDGIAKREEYLELDLHWVTDQFDSLVILAEVMKTFGFSYRQAKDLYEAVLKDHSGAVFHNDGNVIRLDRKRLFVSKASFQKVNYKITDIHQKVKLASLELSFELLPPTGMIEPDDETAYLDFDQIVFPLIVRNWKEGEAFKPLGMKGKKKISDFMIDSKIPVTLKQRALVMESRGEIVWLMGYRIDDRFKITDSTQNILKVKIDHV